MEANPGIEATKLQVGQKLHVPAPAKNTGGNTGPDSPRGGTRGGPSALHGQIGRYADQDRGRAPHDCEGDSHR